MSNKVSITVTIDKCKDCPHFDAGNGWGEDMCRHPDCKKRYIHNSDFISPYCPELEKQGKNDDNRE